MRYFMNLLLSRGAVTQENHIREVCDATPPEGDRQVQRVGTEKDKGEASKGQAEASQGEETPSHTSRVAT